MFVHYRTQGIVLKKTNRGEDNQLFSFYTKDFGKIEVLGRAIRKISSKLRSATEIFYYSEIEFIQAKRHKTLTDAILIEKFANLRKDLLKLKMAHKITEVLNDLMIAPEKDEKVWSLLLYTLKKINEKDFSQNELRLQYYYFLWNLFLELGYLPELHNCPVCHKKLQPEYISFAPIEGGITCQPCSQKIKERKEISVNTVKILRILTKGKESLVSKLKITPSNLKELKTISDYFLKEITLGVVKHSL